MTELLNSATYRGTDFLPLVNDIRTRAIQMASQPQPQPSSAEEEGERHGRRVQAILDQDRSAEKEMYQYPIDLIKKIPKLRGQILSTNSFDENLSKAQEFSLDLEIIISSGVLTQLQPELKTELGEIGRTFQIILLAAYNYPQPQLSDVLIDMRRYINKAPPEISQFWLEEIFIKLLMEGGDQGIKGHSDGKKLQLQLVMYMAQKYPDFIFKLCQDFQSPKPSEIQYILALFEEYGEYDEKGNALHRLKSASTLAQGLQARQESEPEPQSDPEQDDLMRRLEDLK